MKRGSFSIPEIEEIADAVGVEFNREFILGNGEKV